MAVYRLIVQLMVLILVNGKIVEINHSEVTNTPVEDSNDIDDVFNGVYAECFTKFSFPCIQRKTLSYLKQLNKMSEVSVVEDYVKLVRVNTSKYEESNDFEEQSTKKDSEDLTYLIDKAVDSFFDNHIVRFSVLGRNLSIPHNAEEFVGRKKRKGGGGGGHGDMMGGHEGGHTHKKMMMMGLMCMKMKMMMMLPVMMGMMGMMSFKGMMFSMMSFMVSKMMLLMKLLEKKGGLGGGGGGGGGSDGGWAAGGGGGGAWMPAGGQDFSGGGGYDANGQWQSRSILENRDMYDNKLEISYVPPIVTYNNPNKSYKDIKKHDVIKKQEAVIKSRQKRSIIDAVRNSYSYWINQFLGTNNNNRRVSNTPKYKVINGVKYVFLPYQQQKYYRNPKEIQSNKIKVVAETPIITAEDFNKGEIVEVGVESRMSKNKIMKLKDAVNETIEESPWE